MKLIILAQIVQRRGQFRELKLETRSQYFFRGAALTNQC